MAKSYNPIKDEPDLHYMEPRLLFVQNYLKESFTSNYVDVDVIRGHLISERMRLFRNNKVSAGDARTIIAINCDDAKSCNLIKDDTDLHFMEPGPKFVPNYFRCSFTSDCVDINVIRANLNSERMRLLRNREVSAYDDRTTLAAHYDFSDEEFEPIINEDPIKEAVGALLQRKKKIRNKQPVVPSLCPTCGDRHKIFQQYDSSENVWKPIVCMAFIEKFPRGCVNKRRGCTVELPYKQLQEHIKKCEYKPRS